MPSDDEKYILTIDLGTNGPKVALITVKGEMVAHEFEENEVILLPNGGAEQDPDEWWRAISTSAKRLATSNPTEIKHVVAVSCTSQWSGTVAVDQAGNPLMNAIIWMDTRGQPYIRKIAGGAIQVEGYDIRKIIQWLSKTGGAPTHSGKDPIAHILYIQNELPEIYEKTYKFLEPKDYINLKLTGKFAASYDSIALHWVTDNRDIDEVVYDDELFKITTLERRKFPELKRAVDLLGVLKADIASELGLPKDTPVVMGTPDVQSAAIGSGAVKDFEGHLYIGTSSWLTCHVPYKKTDIVHGLGSLPSAIPGRYFLANEQESAGACLKFLKDNILYHEDALLTEAKVPNIYQVFDQVAANAPAGSGKLIFTPWLYGERTPIEDHTIRGGFHNMSLQTTREHLIRAVFEGVAYNAKWLLRYVEKFIGQRMESLNIIGGGANSDLWCQIFADVLDRNIRQVKDPIHANSRGAALLASVALGYSSFDAISEQTQILHTYTPNPENRAIYDELYAEFLEIYKQNKGIYARLNKIH